MSISETTNPIREGNEKAALEFILSNCFKSGFGTLSKTEIDLILFTAILKYSDQNDISDHDLSKYLQITQRRIRNLKEKASVKYMPMTTEEAIDMFLEKVEYARIEDKYLDIPINDIAVKNEIEALLDSHNILLHTQLNPKIFRIRIDDFLELIILIELASNPNQSAEEVEKRILDQVKEKAAEEKVIMDSLDSNDEDIASLSKSTLKEGLLKGGLAFGVDLLASCIPGGAFLSGPAKKLLTSLADKI